MNVLLAAYRYTTNNWAQINASASCGCCNCLQIFSPDEVVAWSGLDMHNFEDAAAINQQTALCPRCGNESVLGDKCGFPIDARFLEKMNEAWFQKTLIRPRAPKT